MNSLNSYRSIETDWDYEVILGKRHQFMSPSLRTFVAFQKPIVLKKGEMQYVWDEKGKRYLDCLAQNLSISVGHCHPLVNSAVRKQMDDLVHCTTMYYHPVPVHLAEELVAKMPSNEDWIVHFVNSGSEAVDLALLMVRLYTGNFEVIALRNSFHGLHFASMSLTGISACRHALPPSPGILHVHNPDPYRGMHGATVAPYIKEIDALISSSTSGNIAGFIAEPIQGYGGVIPLPPGYLQGAFECIRAAGGLCILDEVQTGFARTGSHFWGFESQGVTPDVVVMGKGIGNGYPLAAVVARREIAEAMAKKKFFNTYGSNPVACAAGRAVLRSIEEDGLQQNAGKMGALLMEKLDKIKADHDVIGDVRGRGLMVGVELVKNHLTKEPAPDKAAQVAEMAKENGLIVGRGGTLGNVLRINPPLCIQEGDIQFIADVLKESCRKL